MAIFAKNLCHCIPLDKGCILVGIINIIFSILILISVACILSFESNFEDDLQKTKHVDLKHDHFRSILGIDPTVTKAIMIFVATAAFIGIFTSVFLIIGVLKNKSGFVMSYFVYGVFVVIISTIGVLLEVLTPLWYIAATQLCATCFYVHALIVIYTVYETLTRGIKFGSNSHVLLEDGME